MTSFSENENQFKESSVDNSNEKNDEIDLNKLINLAKRNKNLIRNFAGLGLILGLFYVSLKPKVWEGELQIVLSKKESPINPQSALALKTETSSVLSELTGIDTKKELNTEVEILKSSSVLMPIFNYVKNDNSKIDKKLKYNDWLKNNLDISLERGTSVLNLTYRDKNKDLILPVLNKISA